jgi:hypothetical protein
MMEQPPPFMQSVLTPTSSSTIYASTLPSFPAQQHQQSRANGSVNAVAAGAKRGYEDDGDDVNGRSFQRQRQLNGPGREVETPSRDESNPRDSSTASPSGEPQKKRQKRNKPTLSCFECVERKTKARLFFSWSQPSHLGAYNYRLQAQLRCRLNSDSIPLAILYARAHDT